MNKKLSNLTLLVLITIFCFPGLGWASDQVLKFGVVPQYDLRKIKSIWQPIINEVNNQSGLNIELVSSANIPVFEDQFSKGEFDIVYMNPYHLIKANQIQGYEPILRDTSTMLSGILVVHKDSGIETISQLNGKKIAFPAPNALGASLLPRAELSTKYKIEFQPVYVQSHSSVYLNVVMQIYSAGGGVLRTFDEQPQNIKDSLRIIYTTPEVPTHPIAVHPRISGDQRTKIINAIKNLAVSTKGQELLLHVPIKKLGVTKMSEYETLLLFDLERFTSWR